MTDAAPARPLLLMSVILALSGCADAGNVPASQRGFFGGLGAVMSGADQRHAQGLENTAAQAEYQAGQSVRRASAAQNEAAVTSGQVRAAQARLATLQRSLQAQRARLNSLRAQVGQSSDATAQAARLQQDMDRLDQERRRAANSIGGPSPAVMQQLEQHSKDIDAALNQFSRM